MTWRIRQIRHQFDHKRLKSRYSGHKFDQLCHPQRQQWGVDEQPHLPISLPRLVDDVPRCVEVHPRDQNELPRLRDDYYIDVNDLSGDKFDQICHPISVTDDEIDWIYDGTRQIIHRIGLTYDRIDQIHERTV